MFDVILLNANNGNVPVPSNYGWNLYADISHRLSWIKSPPFICYCYKLKNKIEKSNNFMDGMDHNYPLRFLINFL